MSFLAARLSTLYPHYLVIAYPVPFVVIAICLGDVRARLDRWRPRVGTVVTSGTVALLVACFVAFDVAFLAFVRDHGGTRGDYGVAYTHKAAVADHALAAGLRLAEAPYELRFLESRAEGSRDQGASGDNGILRVWNPWGQRPTAYCPRERRKTFGTLVACAELVGTDRRDRAPSQSTSLGSG